MMFCEHVNCDKPATCQVRLEVPPVNMAFDTVHPYSVILGLCFCDGHAWTFQTKQIVTSLRPYFETVAAFLGTLPPDFDRARIQKIRIVPAVNNVEACMALDPRLENIHGSGPR